MTVFLTTHTRHRSGKTSAIKRKAVRETRISRHHGDPIQAPPPETNRTSQHYRIVGFKGGSSIGSPLFPETLVSSIANTSFISQDTTQTFIRHTNILILISKHTDSLESHTEKHFLNLVNPRQI